MRRKERGRKDKIRDVDISLILIITEEDKDAKQIKTKLNYTERELRKGEKRTTFE